MFGYSKKEFLKDRYKYYCLYPEFFLVGMVCMNSILIHNSYC